MNLVKALQSYYMCANLRFTCELYPYLKGNYGFYEYVDYPEYILINIHDSEIVFIKMLCSEAMFKSIQGILLSCYLLSSV